MVDGMLYPPEDEDSPPLDPDDARRMADLIEALDGWISSGGFLPTDWNRTRTARAP
jgi:hypothetical protein